MRRVGPNPVELRSARQVAHQVTCALLVGFSSGYSGNDALLDADEMLIPSSLRKAEDMFSLRIEFVEAVVEAALTATRCNRTSRAKGSDETATVECEANPFRTPNAKGTPDTHTKRDRGPPNLGERSGDNHRNACHPGTITGDPRPLTLYAGKPSRAYPHDNTISVFAREPTLEAESSSSSNAVSVRRMS